MKLLSAITRKEFARHSTTGAAAAAPHISLLKLPLREKLYVCLIFAVTGSSAAALVRPLIRLMVSMKALEGSPITTGSMMNGPNSYRALYLVVMWPTYTFLLLFWGTVLGRRVWFSQFAVKMWSRFIPASASQKMKSVLGV